MLLLNLLICICLTKLAWNDANLVMMNDLFNMLLNLVFCWELLDPCSLLVGVFFLLYPYQFGYQGNDFMKQV